MTVIIGVDPGSRQTGYGVIQVTGPQQIYIASGYLKLQDSSHPERLKQIFFGLQEVVQLYKPCEAAVEQVFMHRNPSSALKLGQARGAAIVALGVPVSEYSAREIKQSVVGYGAANKEQVQFMVQRLLKLVNKIQADAADALAIALCHAQSRLLKIRMRL
ncbi:MAG: crossover junction endodeoxyribonuclease RuvC [Gammaproteobacteria bacterium RIFCSPHIGHO2_12_FULL_41_20]|nr:MAG: crossover junction endodeoxyribonuclease RuvC [Gammaproteobacteria bacterium RIFCSPHIGHO2_12_FULL_41_20]